MSVVMQEIPTKFKMLSEAQQKSVIFAAEVEIEHHVQSRKRAESKKEVQKLRNSPDYEEKVLDMAEVIARYPKRLARALEKFSLPSAKVDAAEGTTLEWFKARVEGRRSIPK